MMPKRKPWLRCLPVRFILTTRLVGADREKKAPDAVELRPPFYHCSLFSFSFLLFGRTKAFQIFFFRYYADISLLLLVYTPFPENCVDTFRENFEWNETLLFQGIST